MPKKTKREKILAEYRRKVRMLEEKKIEKEPVKPEKKEEIKLEPKLDIKLEKEDNNTLKYFKEDLRKSLFFVSIIIALEVLLYFVRI